MQSFLVAGGLRVPSWRSGEVKRRVWRSNSRDGASASNSYDKLSDGPLEVENPYLPFRKSFSSWADRPGQARATRLGVTGEENACTDIYSLTFDSLGGSDGDFVLDS